MIGRLLSIYAVYLLAAMSPGPAAAYVMRTAVGSRSLGLRAALGVATATTLWLAVAALGLSAALKGSPRLMDAIMLIGGLYFLRLSWVLGRGALSPETAAAPAAAPGSARAAYAQGVVTNATNPKAALFFLGLMGVYNVPAMPAPARAAVYGGIPLLAVSWYGTLSLAFSDERLARGYLRLRRPLDAGLAALFLVLGLKLVAAARL